MTHMDLNQSKISVFLTREQHRDVKILAMDAEQSLTQFVADLIIKAIKASKKTQAA